jgi:hypothetical protein
MVSARRSYAAMDEGKLSAEEAPLLVRSFLAAGLDTTIAGIGRLINCLATHPDQWRLLAENPDLARPAFEEMMRFDHPSIGVFRTASRDSEFAGLAIPKHEKVFALTESANRDPDQWSSPDAYDIRRLTVGHLGFGSGIHICAGMMVGSGLVGARLPIEIDLIRSRRLKPEFAKVRVVVRTSAKRPEIIALTLKNRQIIDARVPPAHQSPGVEFPVFIAIRSEPMLAVIVPFVGEPNRDPAFRERPDLLDEAIVQFAERPEWPRGPCRIPPDCARRYRRSTPAIRVPDRGCSSHLRRP